MRITCAVAAAAALMLAAAASATAIPPKNGCSPARTRSLIDRFVRAFNMGDTSAINGTWASKVSFKCADDLPGGSVAYDGKGASTCSTGRLIAWVMGAEP